MAHVERDTKRELPAPTDFKIAEYGTVCVVSAAGEIDAITVTGFRRSVSDAFARDSKTVVLDLSAVEFIDSSGLHVVGQADRRGRDSGIRLVVVLGDSPIWRVFRVCGFTQDLTVVERLEPP